MTAPTEPQSVEQQKPPVAGPGAAPAPGLGLGWNRVAVAVSEQIPPQTIERIWLFAPVRREWREWGTAVIACRVDAERLRVHTANYLMVIRGREKGQGKVSVAEVGESPVDVLHEVIAGVQERAGEAEPPVEIDPELWYPREEEAPADPSSEVGDSD